MHVIGTAGHVDHGKSTLVNALTGIDPDRLREEKEREMTIDLGFAWLTLGDEEVGIVDVPGHRDFIENMLAGVGGIDLALFVIAADEGVMPQTREHLAIHDLLAVNRGVIALTKIDLVDDPDWLDMVILEVSEAFQGTSLCDAPIVPVSARTGTGLSLLKQTLEDCLGEVEIRPDNGRPRLSIDRVFTLTGFGTVVTGTLLDGSFRVGDSVVIQPGNISARIRGLQTHKIKRDIAQPGSRVAINLTGVDRNELKRGQVVTKPGQLRETRLLDIQYQHLADAEHPLQHNDAVKVFIGAAEVNGHTRLIGREEIMPGDTGWIQLALNSPIVAFRGDRLILRRPSPGSTLGGGLVLDPNPGRRHRRFRQDVLARFEVLAKESPEELLLQTLSRLDPIQPEVLIQKSGLPVDEGQLALQNLLTVGEIIALDKYLWTATSYQNFCDLILGTLEQYHRLHPLKTGIDRESLRIKLQIAPAPFSSLIQSLAWKKFIVDAGVYLRLPDHEIHFSPEQERSIADLMTVFNNQGVNSPSIKECKELIGDDLYYALVETGQLKPVNSEVVYSTTIYTALITQLTHVLRQKGTLTAAEVRDLLGTSRKYAIALLEHLDEIRVTRRVGDVRELIPGRE